MSMTHSRPSSRNLSPKGEQNLTPITGHPKSDSTDKVLSDKIKPQPARLIIKELKALN
jgi:hypothetical protein